MKVLKIIGIVLAIIIVIVLIIVLVAPKDFKVERSIVIPTNNKEVVYKNISHWTEFIKWNPWMEKDSSIKITMNGEEGKVGSNYMWEGNKEVGKGEMTITALKEFESVDDDLHFIEPFETTNKTRFTMAPEGEGYKVTWQMSGGFPFPMNVFGLFMDMDKTVGSDFEKGLNNLKEKCIKDAAASVPLTMPETVPSP